MKGDTKMNAEMINEMVIEIEELEAKIAPSSSATFLD
jgi:hypothetical protein